MTADHIPGPDIARMDAEANAFAMALLMPEHLVRKYAKGIDLFDDEAVGRLAKRFKVPVTVAAIRLGQVMKVLP